ncbi:MAG: hypothetical protein ACYDCN_11785 [Bacteroidia bacterium]
MVIRVASYLTILHINDNNKSPVIGQINMAKYTDETLDAWRKAAT